MRNMIKMMRFLLLLHSNGVPVSPVDARFSKCTKLVPWSIPIVKSGLPFFFISSAAGVPSVTLTPSLSEL
jgi:hypothetical protein